MFTSVIRFKHACEPYGPVRRCPFIRETTLWGARECFRNTGRKGAQGESGLFACAATSPDEACIIAESLPLGEIVTREELQKRLWPEDTFVDFDLSLNSAVKKLRQALNDDSENPRFIETLYRRGYRFIGSANGVTRLEAFQPPGAIAPTEPIPAEPVSSAPSSTAGRTRLFFLLGTLALVASAAVFWFSRSQPPRVLGYTQMDQPFQILAMLLERPRFGDLPREKRRHGTT